MKVIPEWQFYNSTSITSILEISSETTKVAYILVAIKFLLQSIPMTVLGIKYPLVCLQVYATSLRFSTFLFL